MAYKFSSPVMCDCDDCDGTGETTYLHSDSREWGPDFRDRPCEECNGEGKVEHKCPNCGEEHDDECCEICDGCEKCCTCTVCHYCGEKVEDGGGAVTWDDEKWCPKCIAEAHGPWCHDNEKPCSECSMDDCETECEGRAAKVANEAA